jgi:hypothetical protein
MLTGSEGKESPKIAERLMTPAAVLIAVGAEYRAHLVGGFLFACKSAGDFWLSDSPRDLPQKQRDPVTGASHSDHG